MSEADIRAEMEAKRPRMVAARQSMRACITRWTADYEKYLVDNPRLVAPWGPSEYTWFETLQNKVTLKCTTLEDEDREILATYPVEYYAAEYDTESLAVEKYWDTYNNLVSRCGAWLQEYKDLSASIATRMAAAAVPPVGGTHVAGMPTTAKLQLPKQKTPTFGGGHIHWPEFWDRFARIDGNLSLTNAQNLDFLKQCLTGSALNTISFLQSVDRNNAVAKDLLLEAYQNERKIVSAHLEKMVNFQALKTLREVLRESAG
jgi:hypothetical protein